MSGLLVSVRNAAEAHTALEAGVDLIDLKEPDRGALGPVDAATVVEVAALVADRAPLSMALGELGELTGDAIESLAVPRGVRYVKAGLAGCASQVDWPYRLSSLARGLPGDAALVAVVYADAARAGAPGVDEILEAAGVAGCRAVLVDTAVKDGRTLLDHWSLDGLRRFIAEVRGLGLTCVVGGGLTVETVATVAALAPDYVAVRGAACSGGRNGTVDLQRIRVLQSAVGR